MLRSWKELNTSLYCQDMYHIYMMYANYAALHLTICPQTDLYCTFLGLLDRLFIFNFMRIKVFTVEQ